MTLAEAAKFLRMSRSSLYQRKDIPRYRLPGSRAMLFDQDELERLLKEGRLRDYKGTPLEHSHIREQESPEATGASVLEISHERVYHRSARYR